MLQGRTKMVSTCYVLGPSPGSEDAHEEESYDPEEEAMMNDVGAEEEKKKKEAEMESEDEDVAPDASEYETLQKGISLGATTSTRPTPLGFPGLSAGGGGAIIKNFLIDDEEELVEEERRLEFEVRHYEMLLKRAQLESMKSELDKLSLQTISRKSRLLGFAEQRWTRSSSSPSRDARGGRGRLQAWRC